MIANGVWSPDGPQLPPPLLRHADVAAVLVQASLHTGSEFERAVAQA